MDGLSLDVSDWRRILPAGADPSRMILVIFVVSGVVLQAVGLYEPLVKLAGSGATVPLPGFGYALAKGAMDGAAKGFLEAITGPIKATAAGVAVAITFGYLVSLLFTPKSPKGN